MRLISNPPSADPHPRLLLFLLAAASVVCYANILNNALFLDDLDYIVNNRYIRDWRYIPRMFSENLIAGAGKSSDYYRPAIQLAFTFGHSLWQLNPMGYHLLSVGFHVLCGWSLYALLFGLCGRREVAFFSALLFAVHPLQTEAVASASALGILMGLFFMLTGALAYLKFCENVKAPSAPAGGRNVLLYGYSLAAVVCALLSKETMVVYPGLLFLIHYFYISDKESLAGRFKESLLRSAPYLAIVLAYLFLRFTVLNFGGTGNLYRAENVFTQNWHVRFYTFLTVLFEFFKLTLWPSPLHMERHSIMPLHTAWTNIPVLKGGAVFALLLGAAAAGMALRPGASARFWTRFVPERFLPVRELLGLGAFGILWFLFGMVPVSNVFIPISTLMVESWMYMPLIGLVYVFVSILFWRPADGTSVPAAPFSGFVPAVVLCLMASACMVRTIRQNRVWRDPVTFYEHTLRYASESARFRNNLAMAYAESKRYPEAVAQYLLAIQVEDTYPETHHNLANAYLALGRMAEAEKEYYRAIELNPRFHHSYLSLASIYTNYKRLDLAQAILEKLVAAHPGSWEGYYNLGVVHYLKNDRARAEQLWRAGLQVDPYNKTLKDALSQK